MTYPAGVPCWVETLQPDPHAAAAFYRELFGWDVSAAGSMPDGGTYVVARLGDGDVAGIATLPANGIAAPAWTTYVRVDDLESTLARAVDAGGRVVVAPVDATVAHWSVDFWIADVDAAATRVAHAGGTVIAPPFPSPPFPKAVIADPAGAIFTISQLVPEMLP